MTDLITSSRDGAVVTVTIDRPADGNVLTPDDAARADRARCKAAGSERRQGDRAALDRRRLLQRPRRQRRPQNPTALVMRDQVLQPILDVYDALNNAPQPVVCAVQGAALGFGCAMATAATSPSRPKARPSSCRR